MISEELKKKYLQCIETFNDIFLPEKNEWLEKFADFAKIMLKYKDLFNEARREFRGCQNLHFYITIANIKNKRRCFDIRYLGQSVGKISVSRNKVYLTVDKKQAKNNEIFGYDVRKIGEINRSEWQSKEARRFRKFFEECDKLPRIKEHMVESALLSELSKEQAKNKTLCNIQPIDFAGVRFHMVTGISASKAKKEKTEIKTGYGPIDILCRRRIGNRARLAIIEVKDENKSTESFDDAMKQAISYAMFIRELIHSPAGDDWMEIWGLKEQRRVAEEKKTGYTIDCIVAMPEGLTKPEYEGDVLDLDNGDGTTDHLALHYIEITGKIDPSNAENVTFNTSLNKK